MNPFEVLGLGPDRLTRSEVRRAYAAQLRLHPPEGDPAGFRRIRDAYEQVAEFDDAGVREYAESWGVFAASGAAPSDGEGSWTPPPAIEAPARAPLEAGTAWRPVRDPAETRWAEALAAVRSLPPAAQPAAAHDWMAQRAVEVLPDPKALALFGDFLEREFSDRPGLAYYVRADLVAGFLRSGLEEAPAAVLAQWATIRRDALRVLAADLASSKPPLAPPATAKSILDVALAVAISEPDVGRRLADSAYLLAAPDDRTRLRFGEVDARARAAECLAGLAPRSRTAANQVIRRPRDLPDHRAFNALVAAGEWSADRPLPDQDALLRSISNHLERAHSDFAEYVEVAFPDIVQEARRQYAPSPRKIVAEAKYGKSKSGFPVVLVVAGLIVSGIIVVALFGDDHGAPPWPDLQSSSLDRADGRKVLTAKLDRFEAIWRSGSPDDLRPLLASRDTSPAIRQMKRILSEHDWDRARPALPSATIKAVEDIWEVRASVKWKIAGRTDIRLLTEWGWRTDGWWLKSIALAGP